MAQVHDSHSGGSARSVGDPLGRIQESLVSIQRLNTHINENLFYLRKELENFQTRCLLQTIEEFLRLYTGQSDREAGELAQRYQLVLDLLAKNLRKIRRNTISHALRQELEYVEMVLNQCERDAERLKHQLEKNATFAQVLRNGSVAISKVALICLQNYLVSSQEMALLMTLNRMVRPSAQPGAEGGALVRSHEDVLRDSRDKKPILAYLTDKEELMQWQELSDIALQQQSGQLSPGRKQPSIFQDPIHLLTSVEEEQKIQVEKSNIKDINKLKIKDRLQQIQFFLERKIVDKDALSSALMYKLEDPSSLITCVELTFRGDLVLCGLENGKIIGFKTNPHFLPEYNYRPDEEPQSKEEEAIVRQFESLGKSFKFKGCCGAITSLSLLYDQLYFLSASMDNIIRLWCVRQQIELVQYKGHLLSIQQVKFSHKGYYFVSCSSDKTAMLWATDRIISQRIYHVIPRAQRVRVSTRTG